jgi:hypothetical protein
MPAPLRRKEPDVFDKEDAIAFPAGFVGVFTA